LSPSPLFRSSTLFRSEPAVYRYQCVVLLGKLGGRLQLHRVRSHEDPFAVFPQVDFHEVDFLLAIEEVVEMSLLPYHAFLNRGSQIGRAHVELQSRETL